MIPTAEQFRKDLLKKKGRVTEDEFMIEFAKFHVIEALKDAAENSKVVPTDYQPIPKRKVGSAYVIIDREDVMIVVDKDSILNSYPLTNIK